MSFLHRLRRAKSLKDFPVRVKVPQANKNEEFCEPCKISRCEICEHIVCTDCFKSTSTHRPAL